MPQPPDLIWTVPLYGWLLAYHPKLVDAGGNSVPGAVLHHTAFWNENRSDFLCPNKEEHIFGAGSEMTDWAEVPGYGYRSEEHTSELQSHSDLVCRLLLEKKKKKKKKHK